jgi:uroporphyrin-3 C-methyltransferase
MLVLLVVIGLLLAVYAHWRFGQFDERIDRHRGHVAELRATQKQMEGRLQALASDLETSRAAYRGELRGLRGIPGQLDELGQSVEELRARTESPQRAWVRAEALYLLELAGRRLKLEGDVPTAIAAMESADARLATVDDPSVREARRKVQEELAALRSVQIPDLADVLARLGRVEDAVPTLPVTGMPAAQGLRTAPATEQPGALARAWRRIKQAVRDLVALRQIEPAAARLVTEQEESLRRQHLELQLLAARVAAMRPDGAAYAAALQSASTWVEQNFDASTPEVSTALAELASLAAVDIDPDLPPVGEAGRMLGAVIRSTPAAPPITPPAKP